MTWLFWYVAIGIPVQMILLALALDWWDGYSRRRAERGT